MSALFIVPSPLSGLGAVEPEPTQARTMGAAGLAVGGIFGFFALKQYKKGNQGWAALLGLLAVSNLATGGYSVATGKTLY